MKCRMSESDDAEALYISEIRRFVEFEKKFPSSSDSETSETSSKSSHNRHSVASDTTSDRSFQNPKDCVDSSGDDGYFAVKDRKQQLKPRVLRVFSDSSDDKTGEDKLSSHEKESDRKIVTSTPIQPESVVRRRKRNTKRKRNYKREETLRVDENIQRAKEKIYHRTINAQGEWRKNRTYGLPLDVRGRSTSKDDKLPRNQHKVEVQDVISQAVGEPHFSAARANVPQSRPISNILHRDVLGSPTSRTISKIDSEKLQRPTPLLPTGLAVDIATVSPPSAVQRTHCQDQPVRRNSNSFTSTNESHSRNLERRLSIDSDTRSNCHDSLREGAYSPPPDSRWSTSSDTRSSISFSSPASSEFRDSSKIPRSPWCKGKTPADCKLERKLVVQCTRIEHFVCLPAFAAPFVQVEGEKFTIKPEQWLIMNKRD